VYLNGVKLIVGTGKDCQATDGSTITGLAALAASDVVEVVALSSFSAADSIPSTGGTYTGQVTLPSPVINTAVSGSAVLDEDAMGSNSATKLATQQSIKAYADTKAPIAGPTFTGVTTAASLVLTPGSAPAELEGAMYYDSTSDKVNVWNGTAWEQISNLIGFEAKASGGHITDYSIGSTNYVVHTFTSSGVFTPTSTFNVDYLVVAGGGGGGGYGGGGGAGGFRTGTGFSVGTGSAPYSITVGSGGSNASTNSVNGGTGGDSSFSTITSNGGGGGGTASNNGLTGGSGGSGGYNGSGGAAIVTSPVQGFAGGSSLNSDPYPSGGGGGASAVGANYSGGAAGGGGAGAANAYRTGSNITYAGGGGGGVATGAGYGATGVIGQGGAGGGGDGGMGVGAENGVTNTGGGAGGGGYDGTSTTSVSGTGGSGIVIIRYAI